jgi:hypothetical protein
VEADLEKTFFSPRNREELSCDTIGSTPDMVELLRVCGVREHPSVQESSR